MTNLCDLILDVTSVADHDIFDECYESRLIKSAMKIFSPWGNTPVWSVTSTVHETLKRNVDAQLNERNRKRNQ